MIQEKAATFLASASLSEGIIKFHSYLFILKDKIDLPVFKFWFTFQF